MKSFLLTFLWGMIILAGCAPPQPILTHTPAPLLESESAVAPTAKRQQPTLDAAASSFNEGTFFGYTYQRSDGNRILEGQGSLPRVEPLVIGLKRDPRWLVAVPYQAGSLWVAVLPDGAVGAYYLHDRSAEEVQLGGQNLPADMPPLVMVTEGDAVLVTAPTPNASKLSHPVVLSPELERLAWIETSGDLVLWEHNSETGRLAVDVLPDARLLKDEQGRLLFLCGPTDRYGHGVLGDRLEGGSICLVQTEPKLKLINQIDMNGQSVVEGIAPIWADLNDDGQREIVVTVSDSDRGARLVVYAEDGALLAEGPAVGQGFRWRHQIAAAPFGSNGEIMLVDVLTPHLGGIVEFYGWESNQLVVRSSLSGYSSHKLGSRNLDMALTGDLDGDGAMELLVPDQARQSLNGISLQKDTAVLEWTLPLGATLTTNIAGVSLPDGSLALGAGVEGAKLLVWGY